MVYQYEQLPFTLFGPGAIRQLGEQVRQLGCQKVVCVYDSGVKAAGISALAEDSLTKAGVRCVVFDQITSDPADTLVNACGRLALSAGADGFVAIGGGSTLDCAKAASLLTEDRPEIQPFFTEPPTFYPSRLPVVLVPTTAGTGSECTKVAVITNSVSHAKQSLFLRSALAIVDPELTATVPPSVTANTGFDALSHAMESITANRRNPRSTLLAEAAIRRIARALPSAVQNGGDRSARYEMSLASNWAGMAFADTDCHLGHTMADGLSAAFRTPHGLNCIWVNRQVIPHCASAVPEQVRIIGQALGCDLPPACPPEEIGQRTGRAIGVLMRACGLITPQQAGLDRTAFAACSQTAMELDLGLRLNCPFQVTESLVRDLYLRAYDAD